ncbi:MAG: IS3 family transposase [Candidatus Subteraquimicrobiales bacterium]|nr:IS3 family transposase [Candidatus Subteraquimicrobiales bacterium]
MIIKEKQTRLTKTEIARKLGCSRGSLYYKKKIPSKDLQMKEEIRKVMKDNPAYGHKRIAMELKLNKKRILRVMNKFGLKPYRRRPKKPNKPDDQNKQPTIYPNLIKYFCPIRPNVVWVADFTYIYFGGIFIYLATIEDRFTRKIVGFNIGSRHTKELVCAAFNNALRDCDQAPTYHHCDQGSEYDSTEYLDLLKRENIKISMSKKASPWENPHKESYYSNFKLDLGHTDQFETLGELINAIYQTIYYYNNKRIHTKLKMSPQRFIEQYNLKNKLTRRQLV